MLDDHYYFICDEIIIHFWMIIHGNFHPFLDQEHTSLFLYRSDDISVAVLGSS